MIFNFELANFFSEYTCILFDLAVKIVIRITRTKSKIRKLPG